MLASHVKAAATAIAVICLVLLFVFYNFNNVNEILFEPIDVTQYPSYLEAPTQTLSPSPPIVTGGPTHTLSPSPPTVAETGEGRDRTGLLFDYCVLNESDPWDNTIKQYLRPDYNPFKECQPTFKVLTKLEDGKLYNLENRPNTMCVWRCLLPKNDWELKEGLWHPLVNGSEPKCDIIETNCREQVTRTPDEMKPGEPEHKLNTYYEYLHAQVYRNTTPEKEKKPSQPEKPDVHIIVLDSVSQSQFIRSMPKTRHYLREYYDAIPFRYLNKIAINSMPNAMAFLMGKTMLPISKSPMSVGYDADYHNNSHCYKELNDDQFIAFQYQEAGYTTLFSEDWPQCVFGYPDCVGFKEKPVDHYMRPFQLRVEGKHQTPLLKSSIYNGVCRDAYVPQIEYLQDLLDKYPDKPKFTLAWISYVAHNDINALYHTDDYFYNFFKDNTAKLNNSYIFIMGDHGMRFGTVRQTAVGEREDNNPLLFMTLPGSLRSDPDLMSVVRHNAHQLISHYDLYATFADIVALLRPKNSPKPIIRGSSVLKPLPQPRICDRLRIPFEYCICENKKTKLPDDAPPGRKAAALMVENMNKVIAEDPRLKDLCAPLTLSPAATTSEFQIEGNLTIYKVTYKVLPGNGPFWGFVGQEGNSTELKLLIDRFPRLDEYDKTAFCAKKSVFAPYCYCKSLLS